MTDTLREFAETYASALGDYVAEATERSLQRAYELGRRAIVEDVGVLNLALIHSQSLMKVVGEPGGRNETKELVGRGGMFFVECLSPFEMMLRGYRETSQRLLVNVHEIESAGETLRNQNQELLAARQMVELERQRYQELFDFAPGGYFVTNLEGIIQEANSTAAMLLKSPRDFVVGKSLLAFLAEGDHESYSLRLQELQTGKADRVEDWQVCIHTLEGGITPVELRIALVNDAGPMRMELLWLMSDITERKRLERQQVELLFSEVTVRAERQAAQRLQFLAEASTTLAAARDYETLPTMIAHLSIPYLADCCFVHFIEDGESIRQMAAAHSDPGVAKLLNMVPVYGLRERKISPCLLEILRRGEPMVIPEISPEWLENFVYGEESRTILRELNLTSVLLVPLFARQRVIGTISMFRTGDRAPYKEADVALVEELARRSGVAFENTRLYMEVVLERDKAEKASRAKDEFVAILSHELRTPLTAILGWARRLNKGTSVHENPALREGLRALEQSARTLTRLVEDCLDISRISEQKIQLQKLLVDLNGVVGAARDVMKEDMARKDIECSIHAFPTPLWVSGDRTRLEQVILNLLSNAVKYSERGGRITIDLSRGEHEAEIAVRDTGIGIEPESLSQIFQPFRQGIRRWLASESGLGLGLTIAREIVHMHQGGMWAESKGPGSGSTFRVRLPLVAGPAPESSPETAPAAIPEKAAPIRILLVEDAVDVLNLLRIELEDVGFSVRAHTAAQAALEDARREELDVVVSDIKMPGLHGYDFIKRLRQIPGMASVPAIALTGFGMKSDIKNALAAGYDAHLCKPIEVEQLTDLIKKLTAA